MRIGWVLGWAVPEVWFAPLAREIFPPDAEHVFVRPAPGAQRLLTQAGPFDRVLGYSLGAHLLLSWAEKSAKLRAARVDLFAPFFAFPREENLGGRVSRTQVRYVARWIKNEPAAALRDFYAQADLTVPMDLALKLPMEELLWGLRQLGSGKVEAHLPDGWRAWCGEADALLDAARLRELCPQLNIVPRASHHPQPLLRATLFNI